MSVSTEQVQQTLKGVKDPNTQIDFVSSKSVRNLKVNEGDVSLDIVLGYPAKSQIDHITSLGLSTRSGNCARRTKLTGPLTR